jgi:DNA-binding PadR family transcriptional regulator
VAQLRHYYPLSNINIYAVLRELEELGWAESVSEIHGSRVRRVYKITAMVEVELSEWLSRPPEEEGYSTKDPIALKLLLLGTDDAVDLSWLEGCLREIDEEIAQTRAAIEDPMDRPRLAEITLQWQLDTHLRRREFLVEAMKAAGAGREEDETGIALGAALG